MYTPQCPYCLSFSGLVWIAPDANGNAIDSSKPFQSRTRPEPQLAPCVCHMGYRAFKSDARNENAGTGEKWRRRNAEHGVAEMSADHRSGIYEMLERIEANWTVSEPVFSSQVRGNWFGGTGIQPTEASDEH